MSRTQLWALHLSNALVGGTGLVYAWMLYFMTPSDPFSVLHHPWQGTVQHLHVWLAPMLIFAVGTIWANHVWVKWQQGTRRRRRSGLLMMVSLLPMVSSGYFIQTAVGPGWRQAWLIVHLSTSAIWLLAYLVHQVSSVQVWRKKRKLA